MIFVTRFLKKIEYNSPVILTFAIVSFVVLLLNYLTKGYSNLHFFSIYRSSPLSLGFWIRLPGHVLGHANLAHYANNMLLMLLLGPILEEKYSSKILISMMLIVAVITGLLNILLFPKIALLGASGIVFMMMILSSVAGMKTGRIPLTLIVVAVIYIGQELFSGVTTSDNISQFTHIVGGVCGGVFGVLLNRNTERL